MKFEKDNASIELKNDGTINRAKLRKFYNEYKALWDTHCYSSTFHKEFEGNYNPSKEIISVIEDYIYSELKLFFV